MFLHAGQQLIAQADRTQFLRQSTTASHFEMVTLIPTTSHSAATFRAGDRVPMRPTQVHHQRNAIPRMPTRTACMHTYSDPQRHLEIHDDKKRTIEASLTYRHGYRQSIFYCE